MRGTFRLLLDFIGLFNGRPSAQFIAGVGIGTGIGVTLQHSMRSHPPIVPHQFSEEELLFEFNRRSRVVLPPVDTAVACPAAGYYIRFPACYPIDAPPPPNFPLDPVDTNIACPAAGYTITFPACYPIDAPPVSLVSTSAGPSPISKITESLSGFVSYHSDAITGILAPPLYHLLESVTPARSGARKHLTYLQPMMSVFTMHYIWFVIVMVLLSLEPEKLAHQLQFTFVTACEYVEIIWQLSDALWVALQPVLVELPPQEPVLLYHSRASHATLKESASLAGSVASLVANKSLPDSMLSASSASPMLTYTPHVPLATASKPLPPLPLETSPVAPAAIETPVMPPLSCESSPHVTAAPINTPVIPVGRRQLPPYIRRHRTSPMGRDVARITTDRPIVVRRASVTSVAMTSEALEEIRSRYRRPSIDRGVLKGKDTPATMQRNPRNTRFIEDGEGVYPSPKETPVYGAKEMGPSKTRTRAQARTASPTKPLVRRGPLRQVIVNSPEPDYEMVMHTFTSPSHSICPSHLANDCDATWHPAHVPPLPTVSSIDSHASSPGNYNILDDIPDSEDIFQLTSPFLPTHTSSLRDRPQVLDMLSSPELSPMAVRKAHESVQSSPVPPALAAHPVTVLGNDDSQAAGDTSKHPYSWVRVKVLTGHSASLTVREHPVSKELLVMKRVKVRGMSEDVERAFEKEVRVLRAASESERSSRWCSRFAGTYGDKRDMYLLSSYCPKGSIGVLIKLQRPRCLNVMLARFYLAEMIVALNSLHNAGIAHGSFTSSNIFISESRHIVLNNFSCAVTADEDSEALIQRGLLPFKEVCMLDYVEMLQVYHEIYTGRPFALNLENHKPQLDYISNQTALQDLTDLDRLFMNMVVEEVSLGVLSTQHIMAHRIFDGIDWEAVERQEVSVPDLEPAPKLRIREPVQTCLEQPDPLQWADVSKCSHGGEYYELQLLEVKKAELAFLNGHIEQAELTFET